MRAEHLYVHVPFCARRCVYCDFSIAVRAKVPTHEYVESLGRELETRHADSDFVLKTLYFGGGTPSKLGPEGVERALTAIRAKAKLLPDAEITLEANPEDVDAVAVRSWRDSGVNRVSLGVQSFDDRVLAWMHRTHDAKTARRSIQVLRDGGIDNISIDLIFAVPAELKRSWRTDLGHTADLELPHVSVYGLTIEPRTPLGRWVARDDVREEPEERFEGEFLEADALLADAGFDHYEVSNYGKPGMHSRHNWAYWRRQPYGGVGPSAHEFDGRTRRWNIGPYAEWVSRIADSRSTIEGAEELSIDEAGHEAMYLSLRTNAGVDIPAGKQSAADRWVSAGWATLGESTLRLTPSGWMRIDSIANDLTALRSRY